MSAVLSGVAALVGQLADLLHPLFHASATAAAIILLTAAVRLLVHPLSRAAARGQKERARLAPRVAALREKHAGEPERLRKAILALHAEEKVSPLSGCLPSLLQLPAFFLLYHLFSSARIGGGPNTLLDHTLLGAPLGDRFAGALANGTAGGSVLVYAALFAIVAAVATFTCLRTRRTMAASAATPSAADGRGIPGLGAVTRVMPLMSFLTLFTVAVVPLAAALYVVTSTTWGAVERAVLYRAAPRTPGDPLAAVA